jgi:hypothetical protein
MKVIWPQQILKKGNSLHSVIYRNLQPQSYCYKQKNSVMGQSGVIQKLYKTQSTLTWSIPFDQKPCIVVKKL